MRKGFAAVLVVLLTASLVILGVLFYKQSSLLRFNSNNLSGNIKNEPQSSPDISKEAKNLSSGKIAFIKNGNVYIIDSTEIKEIVKNGNHSEPSTIKWSPNGRYLGWINKAIVNDERHGVSLNIFDSQNNKILDIVKRKYSNEELTKLTYNQPGFGGFPLSDFGFSSDSEKIFYAQDGIWEKNITSGVENNILQNYQGKISDSYDGGEIIYTGVTPNPIQPVLLLSRPVWECGINESFDLSTKVKNTLSLNICGKGTWTPDGKSVVSHQQWGRDEGGLWLTSLDNKNTTQVIGRKPKLNVEDVAISKQGKIIALLSSFGSEANSLPIPGSSVYLIESQEKMIPLTSANLANSSRGTLQWSPDSKLITYMIPRQKISDLYIMDSDGKNSSLLATNVTEYSWAP